MKVLQVADQFPPDPGGLATHVERLAHALADRGHDVVVVSVGSRAQRLDQDGLPVTRLPHTLVRAPNVYLEGSPLHHPPWPDPMFQRRLRRIIEAFAPDVIHAHGWSTFSAVSGRDRSGSALICTLHDYGMVCPKRSLERYSAICGTGRGRACLTCDSETQGLPKRAALAGTLTFTVPRLAQRVDAFIAVSDYVRARHVHSIIPDSKVTVIPNFVDLPELRRQDFERDQRPYALYVGPATPHKGRSVLLDAYRRLQSPPFDLMLVGADDSGSDLGRGVLSRGYLTGPALTDAYSRAAVTVVPSRWADPCPTVALEAMGQGCPVIASAVGGLPEMVLCGRCGLLVPQSDPDALAQAMMTLMEDDGRRLSMGRSARNHVLSYTTGVVLPQIETLYAQGRTETDVAWPRRPA